MKILLLIVTSLMLGASGMHFLVGPHLFTDTQIKTSDSAEPQPLYWVAPMDKNYRRDGPGLSPMGMELVPVYEEVSGDDNSIKISPAVENNLGVKVAYVSNEPLLMPIRTVGLVQYDESRIVHLHSRVEGWIEGLGVAAQGDQVMQGQTLFELYSPALVSAQEEYLVALRSGNANLLKASTKRLFALGLKPAQIEELEKRRKVPQTIRVAADKDGFVTALNVRKGMFIKPATEVMSLASLDSVWLRGEIFERQAYLIQQGQAVTARLSSAPDRTWQGRINYIYPELDARTRTLPVRVRLANKDQLLRPNMLMDIQIMNEGAENVLSVPRQAVIKAGDHHRVVKALGDGRYQSVWVEVGLEGLPASQFAAQEEHHAQAGHADAMHIQILKGLAVGEKVVTSAQFLLDSESHVGADLMRMDDPVEPTPPTTGNAVMTSGSVDQVMPAMGMVKITHAAIPEWDWPVMTMDFPLAEHLSLEDFKEGENIHFELAKVGDWDYLITDLARNSLPDEHMHHGHMETMQAQPTQQAEMDHDMMDHAMPQGAR